MPLSQVLFPPSPPRSNHPSTAKNLPPGTTAILHPSQCCYPRTDNKALPCSVRLNSTLSISSPTKSRRLVNVYEKVRFEKQVRNFIHTNTVPIWYQYSPTMVPIQSQYSPNLVPIQSHYGPSTVPSLEPVLSQFGTNTVPLWSQSSTNLGCLRFHFGATLVPV